jgi:hypothetical protein
MNCDHRNGFSRSDNETLFTGLFSKTNGGQLENNAPRPMDSGNFATREKCYSPLRHALKTGCEKVFQNQNLPFVRNRWVEWSACRNHRVTRLPRLTGHIGLRRLEHAFAARPDFSAPIFLPAPGEPLKGYGRNMGAGI